MTHYLHINVVAVGISYSVVLISHRVLKNNSTYVLLAPNSTLTYNYHQI